MKKIIIRIILLISIILPISNVKAFFSASCVDEWKDGVAYCLGIVTRDCWAYDNTNDSYVLLDENGQKIRSVKDLNDDPQAKKGTIEISANVPESLNDIKIRIDIMSDLYSYSLELKKDNGFKVSKEINVDLYTINYYSVEGADGLDNQLPNQFKIYEGETTSYNIDYSKYKTKKKKEHNKVKKIIVIAAISGIALAFIIIILMFLKARSI